MQRTEKYFEKDAFRKSAAGVILAAEADAETGGGRIALDGTVFYPEGGGQPADRGTLTLADGTVLHVTDVHETGGVIWHTVDALPEAAQPGTAVTGDSMIGEYFRTFVSYGVITVALIMYEARKRRTKSQSSHLLALAQQGEEASAK